jgi:hypothetical protein
MLKYLNSANTLAYFSVTSLAKKKSITTLTSVVQVESLQQAWDLEEPGGLLVSLLRPGEKLFKLFSFVSCGGLNSISLLMEIFKTSIIFASSGAS